MSFGQAALLLILPAMLVAFMLDRWRHDVVAVGGLLACVLAGAVAPEAAFAGFGHPAVVTVAAVVVITRSLARTGVVDALFGRLIDRAEGDGAQVALLCGVGAAVSAFMNNVGALALTMPLALSAARRRGWPAGRLLMPLSYATLLGGMVTLIGTPPNLLVSGYREQATGERFLMFDFLYTGLPLALLGVAYLALLGWRLLPAARREGGAAEDAFQVGDYATELRVEAASPHAGRTVAALEDAHPLRVHGILRGGKRVFGRLREEALAPGDLLILETDGATLRLLDGEGLPLAHHGPDAGPDSGPAVVEAVVMPNALIQGSSALSLDLRRRWGVTLLAAARQGRRFEGRLSDARLSAGDVLMLGGERPVIMAALADLGCLPLAERRIEFQPRRAAVTALFFAAAIVAAAFDIVSAAVAFVAAVFGLVVARAIRPAEIYEAIDWSVLVLLAAMIPLGDALQNTGTAHLLGEGVVALAGGAGPRVMLVLLLVATMLVTPVLNNTATVVVMSPIVIEVAARLGVSPTPFLMAVAIGASCDFLTPFGHHNNAIVMSPGGYRFGDYWRVGLGLDVIVVLLSALLIPLVWPW